MLRFAVFIFAMLCSVFASGQEKNYVTVKQSVKLMGSPFDITIVSNNEDLGYINIQEAIGEINRIEKMISSWNSESETSLINRNAGVKPVKVSLELFKLIERCKQISDITNGAFDISYAALDKIWNFDGSMSIKPSHQQISQALLKVNYE